MTATIDRTSPIPLYFQLKQILLQRIENEQWLPGDLIPSEQELQDAFGLSRTTVRQTLTELVHEGLLNRQRGRGTFVTKPKLNYDPAVRPWASGYIQQEGLTPGWRVLSADWAKPPNDIRQRLQVGANTKVFCIQRLRLANDEPIGYHFAYLPESIVPDINLYALKEGGSMRYLRSVPTMAGSQAARTIEAIAAGEPEVSLLGAVIGEPVLTIERLITAADGTVIELLWSAYRGDRFKYQVTL